MNRKFYGKNYIGCFSNVFGNSGRDEGHQKKISVFNNRNLRKIEMTIFS